MRGRGIFSWKVIGSWVDQDFKAYPWRPEERDLEEATYSGNCCKLMITLLEYFHVACVCVFAFILYFFNRVG